MNMLISLEQRMLEASTLEDEIVTRVRAVSSESVKVRVSAHGQNLLKVRLTGIIREPVKAGGAVALQPPDAS